ncbi:MAG: hypothetical protein ABI963_01145 [Rhizomicrobium sp.]
MRQPHGAPGSTASAETAPNPYVCTLLRGRVMESWYVSLVPASVALVIIGYSFFVAYA